MLKGPEMRRKLFGKHREQQRPLLDMAGMTVKPN